MQDDHIKMTGSLRLFLLYYIGILGHLSDNDGDGYENVTALLQVLSRLFYLIQFVKSWHFFLELSSKG